MRSSSARPTSLVGFTRAVVDVTQRENVSFMAGSLAYYAFVFPFGALLVFALAVVDLGRVADSVVAVTGATLSPAVDAFVQRNVLDENTSGALGALVISSVTVLWGASNSSTGSTPRSPRSTVPNVSRRFGPPSSTRSFSS